MTKRMAGGGGGGAKQRNFPQRTSKEGNTMKKGKIRKKEGEEETSLFIVHEEGGKRELKISDRGTRGRGEEGRNRGKEDS